MHIARPRNDREAAHAARVARVVAEVRSAQAGKPVYIRKKAVSHQVPKPNDKAHSSGKLDISELDQILEIDTEAMTCTAEPGVTYEKLVRATLPLGLVPIVVPELREITIGGAVSGCSLESMSFKHGGFHDTCLEYEVITSDGQVLHCTPHNEHQLVFQMMHGSFGTLGILSRLKFRLVPAKPYVQMTYEIYSTLADYKAATRRVYERQSFDFMDGIIHSPTKYVLCLGRFVDRAPYTHRYDWLRVYYQSTATRREDYLETEQYLFRYDRGVTNVHPKSFLGRLFLGRFLTSSQVLKLAQKFHRFLPRRPAVTVDTFLPFSKLDAFMEWWRRDIDFFPIWFVPYKRVRNYEWIADDFLEGIDDELFVDLAIYGLEQPEGRNYYKEIEDALVRLKGIKTLISYNYYDQDTFWTIFNKANYFAAKRVTDPRGLFRDLYNKTCRAARGLEDAAPV